MQEVGSDKLEQLAQVVDACINLMQYELPKDLLTEACKASVRAVNAVAGSIRLVEGEFLSVGVGYGYKKPEAREHPIRIDTLVSEIVHECKPLIVHDFVSDARIPERRRKRMQMEGFKSCVCMPMIADDNVIGILTCYYDCERDFSDEELLTISRVARWIATAYKNHIALCETRKALERLKAAEQRILSSERIRVAAKLMEDIGHHFSNLLMKVMGSAEMGLLDVTEERARKLFESIRDACKDIAKALRLALFEAHAGLRLRDLPLVDINEVALRALSMAMEHATLRGMAMSNLKREIELTPTPNVHGDPERLTEALCEIILNAIEAMMPHGGKLSVRTGVKFDRVQVEISDNGVGMDEFVLSRAKEPFFTTKGERRLGIGLTIAEAIIRQHGGLIHIESEPNAGTTVSITLPPAAP